MTTPNRASLLTKTHKVLKKHYEPVAPPSDRSVLEHLLYACCLENSVHNKVDDVFAKLQESYFDWNEVRVTTASELSEVMAPLSDPLESARRLKSTLQSLFECHYSFDIDFLRKQNLGTAVKEVEGYKGVTPFTVAYVTQNALGGHAIPVNAGVLEALVIIGVVTEAEAEKGKTPGMERAIPKKSGVEFASLIHQLGVDLANSPKSQRVRGILVEIAPDAKSRLPKRSTRESASEEPKTGGKPKRKARSAPTSDSKKKKAGRPAKQTTSSAGKKSAKTSGSAKKKKSASKQLSRKKPR